MPRHLHIDIETYSPESIADCGVYRYAEHNDFRILLIAYAWEGEPTKIIDVEKDGIPVWFRTCLMDPTVLKYAHNATFERVCFSRWMQKRGYFRPEEFLNPRYWRCSMVQCARCGLPLSLAQAGKALGLEEQKMTEGKELIRLFCVPNKQGARIRPEDRPEEWETFKAYCIRDVDVERDICARLAWYRASDFERELYAVDQEINDRGVLIDRTFVDNAVRMEGVNAARLNMQAVKLSGLDNPNSVKQLREWLGVQTGTVPERLRKTDVADLLKEGANDTVKQLLMIRAEASKISNKKYNAMQTTVCRDGRIHGLLQFYGTRTGRWAGRLVQLQNLPQNHIEDLDFARRAVRSGDLDLVELGYGNVPDTLSQLIRTALVAPEGKTFAVCDFSAIEARVIAWLAGEDWVLDVFRNSGDIYCETASQMFKVPVGKHGPNAELRQKGKIAVLALGYGGGVTALEAMGGARMGLAPDEMREIVSKYRAANRNIANAWKAMELGIKNALLYGGAYEWHGLHFENVQTGDVKTMTVTLPSGRIITYRNMQQCVNRFGNVSLCYEGQDQKTKRWGRVETYGGKLTENVVQAIARDCLAEKMIKVAHAGMNIVFHVHDELVIEVDSPDALVKVQDIFAEELDWAPGLPLRGAGYVTPYYKKD